MARQYIVIPHTAAGALTTVATGTALKTLLQVGVPANRSIQVLGWGVSFKGTAPGDAPGEAYLLSGDVAASGGTGQTPDPTDEFVEEASACVGGAALTGHSFTTEGTITASRVLDGDEVHPQTGYSVWLPSSPIMRVGAATARFLRIRVSFTVSVNTVPWICWDE